MVRSSRRTKPYVLLSTVSSQKEAKKIALALIRQKLAACVNIIPNVHSFFKWRGQVDQAHELLLIVKTDFRHVKKVEQAVRKYHSYKVPELIGWPLAWGHRPYLDWLEESVIARSPVRRKSDGSVLWRKGTTKQSDARRFGVASARHRASS